MSSTTTSLTLVLTRAMPWVKIFPFADWHGEMILKFMPTPNPQPRTTDPTRGKENLESLSMDDIKKIYDELFEHAMHLLNDHQKAPELVAGTMIAIAQRIYKTQLNEDEYQEMMEIIKDAPVKPYNIKKVRLN